MSIGTDTGESVAIQTLHADWGGDVSGLSIHDNTFSGTPNTGYVGIYINPDEGVGDVTIQSNSFSGYLKQGIIIERSRTRILENIRQETSPSRSMAGKDRIEYLGSHSGGSCA